MKRLIALLTMLLCSTLAHADFNSAVSLAQQAGAIAGAASACGQDVTLLSSRLQDAFNIMVTDEVQRSKVMMTYLQAFSNAKEMEANKAKIPCEQVLKDYNNLPILKPDYQQTVLPGLRDNPSQPNQPQPLPQLTSPALAPQQPAAAPGQPAAPVQQMVPALATPSTAPAPAQANPIQPPQPTVPGNNPVAPGASAVAPAQTTPPPLVMPQTTTP